MFNDGRFFVGIGPPKTATTWLHQSLSYHPDLLLPPLKEIGYFWEKQCLPMNGYFARFSSRHWFYRQKRRHVLGSLRRTLQGKAGLDKLKWNMRYFLWPHTDEWYRQLFDAGYVSGDITPKYSELTATSVQNMRNTVGAARIVMTVRDPVEREWSRAKMNLCARRNLRPDQVPRDEWFRHFDDEAQAAANDYLEIYDRWAGVFGKENIHLIFIDEIVEDSWEVYRRLCGFLGVSDPDESLRDAVSKPAHTGLISDIPEEYQHYLFRRHEDKMRDFARRFDAYPFPANWLSRGPYVS